ncbi:RNA polymerase sigma factor [Cellulosilyticum sp. WCF-2]|nr:RNA polymerase sigma factor [Cellulosilyticum sp. WCF-2]
MFRKEGDVLQNDDMNKLYERHSKMVYLFLFRMAGSHELAEELTQETFYQAFLSYAHFRGECKASTWLCQIARHVWLQYLRKKKDLYSIEEIAIPLTNINLFDPLKTYILKEEKNTFYHMLQKLPNDMKEVVILRITSELSFAEIGELLGKSETWARTNFFRAKRKLQEYIKEMERS